MNERERPERGQPQGRQRQRSGQGNADVRSGRGAVTRRTRAGASSRQAGSRTRTAKKKDTANFRFLGVMLIVALLLCGGILAVKLLKDRADADGTRQTSATTGFAPRRIFTMR